MASATCPHCGALNDVSASYCGACGKAVTGSALGGGPRIIESGGIATTQTGRGLQADELQKQTRKATGALLAVAVLQCLFGVLLLVAGGVLASERGIQLSGAVFAMVFGLGVVFFGLYLWARRNPLPAAITGLVIYVTVCLADAVADPRTLVQGIVIKIIIVVVLIRAISAGVQHRRIRREMQVL